MVWKSLGTSFTIRTTRKYTIYQTYGGRFKLSKATDTVFCTGGIGSLHNFFVVQFVKEHWVSVKYSMVKFTNIGQKNCGCGVWTVFIISVMFSLLELCTNKKTNFRVYLFIKFNYLLFGWKLLLFLLNAHSINIWYGNVLSILRIRLKIEIQIILWVCYVIT